MSWIKTSERLPDRHPTDRYSQVRVLCLYKGDVEILAWNHEHECWDQGDLDDFECAKDGVEYWMPLPEGP